MVGRLKLAPAGHGLDYLRTRLDRSFRILTGAVILILLITITNVATLLPARVASRRHEIGIRLAVGALRK